MPGTEDIHLKLTMRARGLRPDAMEVTRLVAEAYRDAALAEANMRRAVEELENVRLAAAKAKDCFEVFDALDARIAGAVDDQVCDVLQNFRSGYFSAVVAVMNSEFEGLAPDVTKQLFVTCFASALSHWRTRLAIAVARSTHLEGLPDSIFTKARECANYVEQQQLAYTAGFLKELATMPEVGRMSQVKLMVAVAQIELYHVEDTEDAGRVLGKAAGLAGEDPEVATAYGQYWLKMNDREKARKAFARALDLNSTLGEAYCGMGELFKLEKDLLAAEEQFQCAIRVQPGSFLGYYSLIDLYGQPELFKDRVERLRLLVKKALAVRPDEAVAIYTTAGAAFQRNQDYAEAHLYYTKAMEAEPMVPDGCTLAGRALQEQGNYKQAEEFFRKAIERTPTLSGGYCDLGMLFEEQERWNDALDCYAKALERWSPWTATFTVLAAEMKWRLDRRLEAMNDLLTLLEQGSSTSVLPKAVEFARRYYRDLHDAKSAREVLYRIRSIKGASYEADFQNELGDMYYHLSEYPWAAEHYELACKADPGVAAYQAHLALAVNAQGNSHFLSGEYKEAADLYRAATAHQPNNHVYFSNLASALELLKTPDHRLEEIGIAIDNLRKALTLAPDNSEYIERLTNLEDSQALMLLGYGDAALESPASTPIVVEVGNALVPKVDSRMFLYQLVPKMRSRIERDTGVPVPGLRMRRSYELPINTIQIFLNEAPIEEISFPAEVEASALIKAIESVLRKNCAVFAGIDQVESVLEKWLSGTNVPEFIRTRKDDPDFRFGLCRLLRTLARERISISNLQAICESLEGRTLAPADIPEAVRLVRRKLREELPGNQQGVRPTLVSSEIESKLSRGLKVSTKGYGIDPELAQELVTQISALQTTSVGPLVIVVRDPLIRTMLSRVIQYRVPEASVLSQDELNLTDFAPASGVSNA